jgi:hypothetical protein
MDVHNACIKVHEDRTQPWTVLNKLAVVHMQAMSVGAQVFCAFKLISKHSVFVDQQEVPEGEGCSDAHRARWHVLSQNGTSQQP